MDESAAVEDSVFKFQAELKSNSEIKQQKQDHLKEIVDGLHELELMMPRVLKHHQLEMQEIQGHLNSSVRALIDYQRQSDVIIKEIVQITRTHMVNERTEIEKLLN